MYVCIYTSLSLYIYIYIFSRRWKVLNMFFLVLPKLVIFLGLLVVVRGNRVAGPELT